MNKINKKRVLLFISLLLIGCFLSSQCFVFAAEDQGFKWELDYPWGDFGEPTNLPEYIVWFFNFACIVGAILAVIMIIIGGLQYMTSGGNPTTQSDSKDRIIKAIIGLILMLSIFLILNTINPDFVNLKLPDLQK